MVYYDITAWENIDPDSDLDELKERCAKICQMLEGLGVMKFIIRTEPEEPEQPEPEKIIQSPTEEINEQSNN